MRKLTSREADLLSEFRGFTLFYHKDSDKIYLTPPNEIIRLQVLHDLEYDQLPDDLWLLCHKLKVEEGKMSKKSHYFSKKDLLRFSASEASIQ